MSISINTSSVSDGLVLYFDAASPYVLKGNRSLINWYDWKVGTTVPSGYSFNGDGNEFVLDTNPFGKQSVIWQSLNNDATSNADGGWRSLYFPVDPNKTYRFSTWVRRKVMGNGKFYLGCYGFDSSSNNIGVRHRSGGTLNTNPYFYYNTLDWVTLNEWYLVVGHVFPKNSGTGPNHPDSGIYNIYGEKVQDIYYDFYWEPGTAKACHRSYLYYSTDPTTQQQWFQPRVDLCDGTEPTIEDLLNDIGHTVFTSKNKIGKINSPIKFSNNVAYFDGSSRINYKFVPEFNFDNGQTIELWLNPQDFTQRRNPYNQAYGGGGAITIETNGTINYYWGNTGTASGTYDVSYNRILLTPAISLNTWVHLCVTRNTENGSTTAIWYKNGEQVTSKTSSSPSNVVTGINDIIIGYGYTGYGFIGDIGVVKVYNRALTEDEVKTNFNSLRRRFGL